MYNPGFILFACIEVVLAILCCASKRGNLRGSCSVVTVTMDRLALRVILDVYKTVCYM